MPFTKDSAGAKYNSGASKAMREQGYEVLDSNADAAIFRKTNRDPKDMGWRPTDAIVNHDDLTVTGGTVEGYTD
jgi:hypothetical protein